MASQSLIIAKLGGLAANVALDRFRYWASLRNSKDRREWDSEQWPDAIRTEADVWCDELRKNSFEPPVLFYSEHNDYWSFYPPTRFIGEHDDNFLCVFGNRYEAFCIALPLSPVVVADLEGVQESGQWSEDRLFARLTLHAVHDWEALVAGGALVFLRQVLRGAIEDEEVIASLEVLPGWMSGSSGIGGIAECES